MKVGVLGAGVMGAGIAQSVAVGGADVVCVDTSTEVLARASRDLVDGRFGLAKAVARGKLAADELDAVVARIAWRDDTATFADADLIIEAVPEDLALKIRVFRQLDRVAAPAAVLATNSSGFPVGAIAAATDRPGQVIGWHWSSPAQVMTFAEIVVTPQTAPATVELVTTLARALGKNPVVVQDQANAWGYVANRIYFAAIAEAQAVVRDGVSTPEDVDRLMVDCFRWPVGPFGMMRGATEGWAAP